ncbi:serine/arginine-rich SC35-like splicing factor SCL30A [Magnolia sinica]|uniref:serine/arginine-rich SC35-like splicing factor SCL30A n=1 Tax=Magnolia sinica TaxID=86752 RepID=UPI0026589C36|nr:serine/arginine-rich SC35-like splicing factor SCL30A [Magnolia sinica]
MWGRSRGLAPSKRKGRLDAKCRKTLFVGNLRFSCSMKDIFKIFQRYGRISEVYLPHFPGTSKSRAYTFVRYMYEDVARAAKGALDRQKIDGREVAVKEARPKPQTRPATANISFQGSLQKGIEENQGSLPIRGAKPYQRGWEKPPASFDKAHQSSRQATTDPGNGQGSRFKASAIDVARISDCHFLIVFKSKAEHTDFVVDAPFWELSVLTGGFLAGCGSGLANNFQKKGGEPYSESEVWKDKRKRAQMRAIFSGNISDG